MITTLDAQPQEWMEGDEKVFHTVAACHFENEKHIEHWINKLVPRNQNGDFVKWSGGKRKSNTRDQFVNNCIKNLSDIDFQVNCISTTEGEMGWFAWLFYTQNRNLVTLKHDSKNRTCLDFNNMDSLSFPVLRAGYLIWYHHVIRYLDNVKNISGMLLADNFASDTIGPGDGKALGVSFVNYLLAQCHSNLRVSLALTEPLNPYLGYDRISDYFCGWINSIRSETCTALHKQQFNVIEAHPSSFIDSILLKPKIEITDENGNDITKTVQELVASQLQNR